MSKQILFPLKNLLKTKAKKYKQMIEVFLIIRSFLKKFDIVNKIKYNLESYKRAKLSFFQYERLSREMLLYSTEYYPDNSFYGHNRVIKNLFNLKRPIKGIIEHGYYFGNYVPKRNLYVGNHSVITFGEKRLHHIQSHLKNEGGKKNVITIGPYILYADGLLTAKAKKDITNKYGNILLVFPIHSIEGVNYAYDNNEFLDIIKKKSKGFDNVFVCMYWKDILKGKHVIFQKEGYKIVTAGHRNDPNFLRRLKDIIFVSKKTMSNGIGTHIGYCVSLKKPHFLFNQSYTVYGENMYDEFRERDTISFNTTKTQEENEIISVFSKDTSIVTMKQQEVVDKYWGKKEVVLNDLAGHQE